MNEAVSEDKRKEFYNRGELWLFLIFLLGIIATRLYNYLLFHSLVELFSIVIAITLFIITYNLREIIQNKSLLFLGLAYLFVALIDLVHTLAYKGMGVFPNFTANLPTQLWIAARYLESISLFLAPFFLERPFKTRIVLISYFAITLFLLLSIFLLGVFPTCYVEGKGLTNFKIFSEYITSVILLLSMLLFF